ncbi:DUF4225 domain-containing protein [Erwinia sp. ErVv1]|uniref:DUF4225 domain-containing protein n=1 Tax=Erwinia sp. ErVv1 TaxID=1603299 RepID=UPI00082E4181|nr:DUF4225 domain-containing protein [Erwinia sp. ErVv1]
MDNYVNPRRFSDYYLTMANLQANQLYSIANTLSLLHIQDALLRINFKDEIQSFITLQLDVIRSASTDNECQACIQNLKQEHEYLTIQDRMLRSGHAVVSASVQFYHDHEKIIGYVIEGIGVVLGGLQMVAGATLIAGSVATGNVIGVVAGGSLVLNGAGSAIESTEKLLGRANPTSFMRNAYEDVAEFMGFDKKLGFLAYQAIDFTTSYYGVLKLTLKPESWRLFNYLPSDYYRKVQAMSKPALILKGTGAAKKGIDIGKNLNDMNTDHK